MDADAERRRRIHAALGDPIRFEIVERLRASDHSAQDLQRLVGVPSNLLAHHLDVLEAARLIRRVRSAGDKRRRYVQLIPATMQGLVPSPSLEPQPVLFVCTANSARSQLAAALWRKMVRAPAESAGTAPAATVHPMAVQAARRAGLTLGRRARPRRLNDRAGDTLMITVCDRAHEELRGAAGLHWSVPDPVAANTVAAFDDTVGVLAARIADTVALPTRTNARTT